MDRIAGLPEPARGLVAAMIAWYDLRELRREPARGLELPEFGIAVDLYGLLPGSDAEVLGLLRLHRCSSTDGTTQRYGDAVLSRLDAGWGAVHADGLRIGDNLLEFPDDRSVCQMHLVAWRRGRLLVPSANLTTFACHPGGGSDEIAWTEEPVGIYEYLTGSALDDSRACRHTFAVGDVYFAVHAYDYAEGSGTLELWWESHRLASIALPLRVRHMQWQGSRLHVAVDDAMIIF